MNSSSRVKSVRWNSIPSSLTIWMTLSRVMPRRIPELAGGVLTTPFFTRKMFSPGPSATMPAELSRIASS